MKNYKYDVFLSHNRENKPWVREFYKFLCDQNLNVFLDEESIRFGEDLSGAIEKGIEQSRHILLILSTHALESPWVAFEEALSVHSDPDASAGKVIPILLESVDENSIRRKIRRLRMVDLIDPQKREYQLRMLLRQLNVKNAGSLEIPNRILVSSKSCNDLESIQFSLKNELLMIEKEQQKKARFNIAVVGKTGVGKSSLINYLFGENIRKVGVGKPITEQGFHREDVKIKDIPATLFDSWGLEVGNSSQWLSFLEKELRLRSTIKPAQEWFHTIFYCISASGSRIENFEIQILKKFLLEKYKVIVVMTKSDLASQEDIDILAKEIHHDVHPDIDCIAVCSEEKQLRNGRTEKFGDKELYSKINLVFWQAISQRLPSRCINILKNLVDEWADSQKEYIDESIHADRKTRELVCQLELNSNNFSSSLMSNVVAEVLDKEVKNIVDIYSEFSKLINSSMNIVDVSSNTSDLEKLSYNPSLGTIRDLTHGPKLGMATIATGGTIGILFPSLTIIGSLSFVAPIVFLVTYIVLSSQQRRSLKVSIDSYANTIKDQIEKMEPAFSSETLKMLRSEGDWIG